MNRFRLAFVAQLGFGLVAFAQCGNPSSGDLPPVDAGAMLKTATADLPQRIARFKPVRMPFAATGLDAGERQVIDQLVIASRALERGRRRSSSRTSWMRAFTRLSCRWRRR